MPRKKYVPGTCCNINEKSSAPIVGSTSITIFSLPKRFSATATAYSVIFLSLIVHKERSEQRGRALCERLKDLIPRQQFKVAIQAAIGGKVIARETVASFRKDVTQKLYGGDVTRKNKLLDKQKKGKKRMRQFGKVDIPQNTFLNALEMNDN